MTTTLTRFDTNYSDAKANERQIKYTDVTKLDTKLDGRIKAKINATKDRASFAEVFKLAVDAERHSRFGKLDANEQEIFINAVANRGVLDRSKKRGQREKSAVESKRSEMQSALADSLKFTKTDGALSKAGERVSNQEVYKKAAVALFSSQISDADNKSVSKRKTDSDTKLVDRAFSFVRETKRKAQEEDANLQNLTQGYMNSAEKFSFHENAKSDVQLNAAGVKSTPEFDAFFKSVTSDKDEKYTKFKALGEIEKRFFIYALAHAEQIKMMATRFGSKPANATARESAKKEASELKADGAAAGALKEADFRMAALNLISKNGVHQGAGSTVLSEAFSFVNVAAMERSKALEEAHKKEFAGNAAVAGVAGKERSAEKNLEKASMRMYADEVQSVEDLLKFIDMCLQKTGGQKDLATKINALSGDDRALFVMAMANRQTLLAETKDQQKAGRVANEGMRQALIKDYLTDAKATAAAGAGNPVAGKKLNPTGADARKAAINLLGQNALNSGEKNDFLDLALLKSGLDTVNVYRPLIQKSSSSTTDELIREYHKEKFVDGSGVGADVTRNTKYRTQDSVLSVEGPQRNQWKTKIDAVVSRDKFTAFFMEAMAVNRNERLALRYARMADNEKEIFITAVANRGILDRSKKEGSRTKAAEENKRAIIKQDMVGRMKLGQQKTTGTTRAEGDESRAYSSTEETYKLAARNLLTRQISDADESLSSRKTLVDFKLVERAYSFVSEINNAAQGNDNAEELESLTAAYMNRGEQFEFHDAATHDERARALTVNNMQSFTEFYEDMHRQESTHVAEFQALPDMEKRIFIYALAHAAQIRKHEGPARKVENYDKKRRQDAKTAAVGLQFGDETAVTAKDYGMAAITLLGKRGRYQRNATGYNQAAIYDAMHFVRAVMQAKITKYRKEEKINLKTTQKFGWDEDRAKMLVYAKEANTMEKFKAFVEMALEKQGDRRAAEIERFKEIAESENQINLLIHGIANRKAIQKKSDQFRFFGVQAVGELVAADVYTDSAKRTELKTNYRNAVEKVGGTAPTLAAPDATTIKNAAVTLLSRETQNGFLDMTNFIDVGMLNRAFKLVDDAEKDIKKSKAKKRGEEARNLQKSLWTERDTNWGIQKSDNMPTTTDQEKKAQAEVKQREEEVKAFRLRRNNETDRTKEKQFQFTSRATESQVSQAFSVGTKADFEAFFAELMDGDLNGKHWDQYEQLQEDQQNLFIKALANRDVIDRKRDKAQVTRFARVWDLHGYRDRGARDALKADFAKGGEATFSKTATANEVKMAAINLLSRESRRANWVNKKFGSKTADTRLIKRAFKLVEVATDKREQAEDKARNTAMNGDAEYTELTRRAQIQTKELADKSVSKETFEAFLRDALDVKYLKKYAELSEGQKKSFARALANRKTIDKAGLTERAKTYEDDAGRKNLIEQGSKDQAPTADEYKKAAYAILSSKTRTLGTHRFLGIKSGAVDKDLVKRALELTKEVDAKKDETNGAYTDRAALQKAMDVTKISSSATYDVRKQAFEATDIKKFTDFFETVMEKNQKEKYSLLFKTYGETLKKRFIAALGLFTDANIEKKMDDQHKDIQNKASALKAEDFRKAAYRIIEHKKGNTEAVKYAKGMVEESLQMDFNTADATDKAAGYEAFAKKKMVNEGQDLELGDSEFHSEAGWLGGDHQKSAAVSRHFKQRMNIVGRSIGSSARSYQKTTSETLQHNDEGTFKHGLGNFLTVGGRLSNDPTHAKAKADSLNATDEATFIAYIEEYGEKDKRKGLVSTFKSLSAKEKQLFILALQDRTVLDLNTDDDMQTQNEEGHAQLLNAFAGKPNAPGENAPAMEALSAEHYKKAAASLTTSRVTQKSRAAENFDKTESRSTNLDWSLFGDALRFVRQEAKDAKLLYERSKKDQRDEETDLDVFRSGKPIVEGEEDGLLQKAEGAFSIGSAAKDVYGNVKEVKEGVEEYQAKKSGKTVVEQPSFVSKVADKLDLSKFIDEMQKNEVVAWAKENGSAVLGIAKDSIGLIKNSVELGMESYAMHKLRSGRDEHLKSSMTLDTEQKLDIIEEAIQKAYGSAIELQAKSINDKVFDIMESALGVLVGGISFASGPISKIISGVGSLILKGSQKIVTKIIELCGTKQVDKHLNLAEETRKYNQRISAYNNMPGRAKGKKLERLTESTMRRKMLSENGFRNETECKRYICNRTANCLLYAYGGSGSRKKERMTVGALLANLKVGFNPMKADGAPNPREISKKLMEARG